ncbi:MAG: glycosyl transferase [Roseburia sp.]|nr:glycosyl transferase [Roseburia sp.]
MKVDFYCDNNVKPGTVIRDNIKVKDIEYLYQKKDRLQVFLTVSGQYQDMIIEQLYQQGISNVIVVDHVLLAQLLDSIDMSDDESVQRRYHAVYNDIVYLEKKFENRMGCKLNFDNPLTFNEKLQWLKVYNRRPEYIQMVDKYAVKEYVAEKIGAEYIIPTLGVWDSFEQINFEKLPQKYVLKCTHDAGSIVIVDGIKKFNKAEARRKLNTALGLNYFWMGREWPYKNVRRRIIAEKYMSESSEMIDYKFLCFNGKVKTIFTCTERFSGDQLKVTFFDTEWNRMPFERHYPASTRPILRPLNFKLMIELAEELSKGIPFVRVDFYEMENRVYFGEMTFFPGGGMEEFTPEKWDRILGDWITLPEKTNPLRLSSQAAG